MSSGCLRLKMRTFLLLWCIAAVLSSALGAAITAEDEEDEVPTKLSLVLFGRKGSGITSTVRQLLGPNVAIHPAEVAVASTDILEYTLRLQEGSKKPVYLSIADVPGLELTEDLEHDAEILSTLKSYLHDKGLPTFLLVVYRFDDKDIAQPDSKFRQLLKRVKYFQQAIFRTSTDNTVFLLTRLLNEPASVQKSPNARINEFRSVIQQSMDIPSTIEIVVGDNKPDPETVQMEKGFIKLPNGELYPKNIWDKLIQISDTSLAIQQNKDCAKEALTKLIQGRETLKLHTQETVAHATDEDTFESDLEAFEFLLRQKSIDLPRNEIQMYLEAAFEDQDALTQIASCAQFLALQLCLRNLKKESVLQLPQTLGGNVKFFQEDMEGVMTSKYSLYYLKQALDIDIPKYPLRELVVGRGYDVINDRLVRKSPFLKTPVIRPSSSLGFQFPDFMECEKMPVEEVVLANSSESLTQCREERLKSLVIPDKANIVPGKLEGEPPSYLNCLSQESQRLVGRKEVRLLECKIVVENESMAFVDESFITAINNLGPLNTSCEESVTEWKLFIHLYGTHIITRGYGGGYFEGTLLQGGAVPKEKISDVLNQIVNFGDVKALVGEGKHLIYQFHSNDGLDIKATHLNELDEHERETILANWQRNLNYQFEMLTTDLELAPLSQVVGIVNATKGTDAETATKLLMEGNLKATQQATGSDAGATSKMVKARNQANALQIANAEKIAEKLSRINEFLAKASG